MSSEQKKIKVVIDLSTTGNFGGPYVSSTRIMQSALKEKYDFEVLHYDTGVGSGISIKRILDLKRQLIDLSPNLVHFTGLQLSGFHVAVACRFAGIKNTVLTIHGTSADAMYFNPIKRLLMKYVLEPITLLLTKRFYGVSSYVIQRKIALIFKRKCAGAIYNLPPKPLDAAIRSQIQTELGLADTDILIVSVARITRDKGYDVLDKAILKFKNDKNVKFVIIGDGDYLNQFKEVLASQISSGQVFCLGYRTDVQQILRGCDIFVLPTLHETLSIALLEASREGLALVASDTGGVPEIVETGYNGELVPVGDVAGLYRAMSKLSKDKDLRIMYGAHASIKVEEKFSASSIVDQIDAVYQKVLQS